jgi:hypothetical protein
MENALSLVGTEVEIQSLAKHRQVGDEPRHDEILATTPPSIASSTVLNESVDDDPHRPVSPANPAEMLFLTNDLTKKREHISAVALAQHIHESHQPLVALPTRTGSSSGSRVFSALRTMDGTFVTARQRSDDSNTSFHSNLPHLSSHSNTSSVAAPVSNRRVPHLGWSPSMDSIDDDNDFYDDSHVVDTHNDASIFLHTSTVKSSESDELLPSKRRPGPLTVDIFATAVKVGPEYTNSSPSTNKSENSDIFHEASESHNDDDFIMTDRSRPAEESTSEIDVLHVDAAEKVYVTVKQVWGWGNSQWFAAPFLGLAESVASKVVEMVAHTTLPALDQEIITPNLYKLDDHLLNPTISKVFHTIMSAFHKTEDIVKPVMITVLTPLGLIMPPADGETETSTDVASSSSSSTVKFAILTNEPPEVSTSSAATAH